MTANKVLDTAKKYIGVKENPPNSNNIIFNTHYYGRSVSGSQYAWCAVFIWDIFRECGVSNLFYGGGKTAYCPTLLNYHKNKGQGVSNNYESGDVIFFNFNNKSNAQHVGICESFDGTYITTIDGNTGTTSEANGGAVMRRKRHKKYIVGAYRPKYKEDSKLTESEIRKLIQEEFNKIEQNRADLPASSWAKSFIKSIIQAGIMEGANGKIERPQSYVTRQEMATIASKILENFRS